MAQSTATELSRRGAVALAAALAATVATAVGTVGGLRHWQAQTARQPAVPSVVQLAPAHSLGSQGAQFHEVSD